MNYIDLKNSYIYLKPNSQTTSRVDIKSILEDHSTNTKYFLTKECRQEVMGPNPFDHPGKAEYCAIVNDKKERLNNRDISPVLFPFSNKQKQQYIKYNHDIVASDDEIDLKFINYKKIESNEIINQLHNKELEDIYAKFHYQFENKSYTIFSQLEYINFIGKDRGEYFEKDFLQLTCGYVPFIKDKKVFISYLVQYISGSISGNLEFRLREHNNLKDFLPLRKNYLKILIQRIFLLAMSPIKFSEFSTYVSIQNTKIEFYQKVI